MKLSFLLIPLFFIACNSELNEQAKPNQQTEETKAELASNIEQLHEKIMFSSNSEEAKKGSEELLEACKSFEKNYPKDPRCAEYMFMAAKAANGLGKYNESLTILERITKVYPNYENLIEVYFLYAFTLDEDLNEKDKAKVAYMKVMNKFPGEPLSKQAEVLISQLYLTDEELIKQFSKDTE